MTTIMLKDAPGGAELIDRLVAAAGGMALAFVEGPDDKVRAHLDQNCDGIERALAEAVGAGTAREMVSVLLRAVLAEKARLEASSQSFLKN